MPIDPRLTQIRTLPQPGRVALFCSIITMITTEVGPQAIQKVGKITESDHPCDAARNAMLNLMTDRLRYLHVPIAMTTAEWIDISLRRAYPQLAEVSKGELTLALQHLLTDIFGTGSDRSFNGPTPN